MRPFFCLLFLLIPATVWAQSPAFTGPARSDALTSLVDVIADADRHGLRREDYHFEILATADPRIASAEIDRLAENAFRNIARDLLTGRINPLSVDRNWPFAPRSGDIDGALMRALDSGDVTGELARFEPQTPAYEALIRARLFWLKQADENWPPVITARDHIEAGDSGADVRALRVRLVQLGRLRPFSPVRPVDTIEFSFVPPEMAPDFDAEVETAVRNVQQQARLRPDGIAGSATLDWLNRTPGQRAGTLRANLERLRWLPDDFGARHIVVNVPDFTLQAVENGNTVRRHDVIVGRVSRPSPVLSAELAYLVVNPWWETPHSLAVNDELPLFRRDPGAVARLGFQVLARDGTVVDASTIDWTTVSAAGFPYRLRQAPGPLNALGVVKLIFPNPHSTFLHDTPGRERFNELPRALSSGCVRVRDAVALAQWAVSTGGPDMADIAAIVAGRRETRIDIGEEIRVHFLYLTAFPDENASVRMVHDLYAKDPSILEAMDRSYEDDPTRNTRARPGTDVTTGAGGGHVGDCPA